MRNLRDRPIRQKITLVIMMIAGVVLPLAFAALFCFQAYTLKQHSAHELAVVGEITAHNCAAAVMFKDEDAAAQILGGLRTMPQIVSARLELVDQQRLAFFGAPRDETQIKAARLKSGFQIDGDRILLAQPVMLSGTREGTLYLLADLHATTSQLLKLYGGSFALVLVASLLVAFILSSQFLHIVTSPILRLAGTARSIADHNDYSVRATKVCGDEVGVLTDAFNQMLAQIQSQDTALRDNENKLAQAQAIAHLGYWERDLDTDRIMWSKETNRVFGLSPEENVDNFARFQELIYPEDRQMVMQAVGEAVQGGPRYDMEYRVVWPGGEVRFVHSQGDVILDEAGQPRRMFGTVQDVTERKLAEDAAHETNLALGNAMPGISTLNSEGRYERVNKAYAQMLGYLPNELVGMDWTPTIAPEDRKRGLETYRRMLSEGKAEFEARAVRKDGSTFYKHVLMVKRTDVAGKVLGHYCFMRDITERKQAEEALRQAEQKYRSIFENAIEGIFQTTPEGRYISVNPALARMYGYGSPEELIGSVSDIGKIVYVNPKRRTEFKRLIEAQGFVEGFEYEVYRKDRRKIWLSENARAVRGADGVVLYYEGSVQDITERKRVDEVERASTAKSEFLSRMSHELRTPLNAILGFGQLLEKQEPTDVQRARISYILSAGRHLLELINEVLDIARIEAGRMQFSLEPVCVIDAVDEAIGLVRPLAMERKIQIERTDLIEPRPIVLADRQRLKQVLLNLLANAVKYNRDAGRVIVDLAPQPNERFRISMIDEGPGIPPEKRSLLFSPFERLGAEAGLREGTGLGLALSKRLVEAMGGAIGESAPASGSCFWIEFPQTKQVWHQPGADSKLTVPFASLNGRSKTLLYIEDNVSNLTLIEHLLSEYPPIKLISAMQGSLGLELAVRHQPDLILLDVHLPDLSGAEVLSRLKAAPRTSAIPVVVLSADATKSQIDRLMAAGANDYLTKPLEIDRFSKVVEAHLCETATANGNHL